MFKPNKVHKSLVKTVRLKLFTDIDDDFENDETDSDGEMQNVSQNSQSSDQQPSNTAQNNKPNVDQIQYNRIYYQMKMYRNLIRTTKITLPQNLKFWILLNLIKLSGQNVVVGHGGSKFN
jgi:hypothetical protein